MDLLRIQHFGAMVVRRTTEYHKNQSDGIKGEQLNVNHFFVGGVTADVDTSVLEVNENQIMCWRCCYRAFSQISGGYDGIL